MMASDGRAMDGFYEIQDLALHYPGPRFNILI